MRQISLLIINNFKNIDYIKFFKLLTISLLENSPDDKLISYLD